MRFQILSQDSDFARKAQATGKFSALALGAAFCMEGIFAGPLHAAPTIGGDDNGPKVQILQPNYQDVIKGNTGILIAVQAAKFNPEFVEILVDDREVLTPTRLTAFPSARYDWDTRLFVDGPHKLTVRVTDTQGFRGWAEVTVYINNQQKLDNAPPSLSWLNVKPEQHISGTAQIQLQALDNFGVKWIIVAVNPQSSPNQKPPLRSWLLNRPPYNITFDSTQLPDGIYQLSASAWDSREQEGNAPPLNIDVVNNAINATTLSMNMGAITANARPLPGASSPAGATPQTSSVPASAPAPQFTLRSSAPGSENTASALPDVSALAQGSSAASSVPSGTGSASRPAPHVSLPATGGDGGRAVQAPLSSSPSAGAPASVALPPQAPAAHSRIEDTAPVTPPRLVAQLPTSQVPLAPPALTTPSQARAHLGLSGPLDAGAPARDTLEGRRFARLESPEAQQRALPPAPAALSQLSGGAGLAAASPLSVVASGAPQASVDLKAGAPSASVRQVAGTATLTGTAPAAPTLIHSGVRLAALPPAMAYPDVRMGRPESASRSLPGLPAWSTNRAGTASLIAAAAPVMLKGADTAQLSGATLPGLQARSLPAQFARASSAVALAGAPRFSAAKHEPHLWAAAAEKVPAAAVPGAMPGRAVEPKLGAEAPRFARLPRNMGPGAQSGGAISAITVAPLELTATHSLPAFHHVVSSTNLQAVANKYGLPVEILAQCNHWSTHKKLVAGERVALPSELQIAYKGQPVKGDVASLMVGSTSVTPFRFLWEQQGGTLTWDAAKHQVVARKGDQEVVLSIGSKTAKVNDREVMMEMAAFLMSGRTMVPVRLFEKGLHAQVQWEPETGRLYVAMAG
jgi:hypothetical protein